MNAVPPPAKTELLLLASEGKKDWLWLWFEDGRIFIKSWDHQPKWCPVILFLMDSYLIYAAALTIFVVAVSFFDLRERRIPNFLVFPAAFIGLVFNLLWRGWDGLIFGLKGLGLAFLLLLIPYMVGGMKAGDVKFLMAIGAFTGAIDVLRALLATVLCYPLFAAFAVIREGKLKITWLRFRRVLWNFLGFFLPSVKLYAIHLDGQDDKSIASVRTPFGVAIALGTMIAVFTGFLQ